MDELKRTAAEFEDLIRKIARIMNKRLRNSLRNSTITPPQLAGLVYVYRDTGMTIGDLCDKMFLACSTVSGLVDRLEKMGLMERYRDETDRRVVRLKLTEKGTECTEEILEERREKLMKDLEMVSVDQQKELIGSLNQLLEIMNDAESKEKK